MEKIKKPANLLQTQAKSMFKKYARGIVKILKSKGVKVIEEIKYADGVNSFCWDTCITKKSPSKIYIHIYHYHGKSDNPHIKCVNFFLGIDSQKYCVETDIEKEIRKTTKNTANIKYPLSNIIISAVVGNHETPKLEPEKEVAKQLYRALKCHNKIYSPPARVKIEKAKERIKKFTENEVDKIVESFFR